MKKKLFLALALLLPLTSFAQSDNENYEVLTDNNDPKVIHELYVSRHAEAIGNTANPQIVIVDFFDNNCKDCRAITPMLDDVAKKNPKVKIIFRELPVLGDDSKVAATAAFAAEEQNKYLPMHQAMMSAKEHINLDWINRTIKTLGLDLAKFQADMGDKEIQKRLEKNNELADKLNIQAVPTIYITSTKILTSQEPSEIKQYVWLGALDEKSFNALLNKVG